MAARLKLLRLLSCAALTAWVCAGCRQDDAVLIRLAGPGAGDTPGGSGRFAPQTDLSLEAAWRWKTAAGLTAWSFLYPTAAATLAASGGGIDLGPLRTSHYLAWHGRLAASGVDVLRFRFAEPLTDQVELYWNGEGEDFAPQRYLLRVPDPRDPHEVAFDLGASRQWRGTVTRLGLRLIAQPPERQALLQVEGLRYVAPKALGSGETKYVSLDDGRGMQAWLAQPGSVLRRRIEVPRKARLRLHAAPWLAGGNHVKIRIAVQGRHGRQVLVERELRQPADPPRRRWTPLEADLTKLAGETVDLLFEAGPARPGSLVIWGAPQVVAAVAEARERRPNVVLISLDTVRADHLSLYGYRRRTTPNLDAWARRWATVFETAVASAPWTLPSHLAMLSGVDAVHHGVNRRGPIPRSFKLLPQRFQEAGYATYATTAGVLLTPELGFAGGFDDFRVRGRMESLPEWNAELGAGVNDALRWMAAHRGERFFLFLHTYEAHSPYQPREPYYSEFGGDPKVLNGGQPVWMEAAGFEAGVRALTLLFQPANYADGVSYPRKVLGPQDRELVAALYDSGLAYIDRHLGRLFEYLEAEGLMEDTIVVITSDHGEALYEHGLVGHSSLYDHDLLVPLVVAAPLGTARGLRIAEQVRSVDIAPTLLQLAGLPVPEGIDGRSLVPFLRGRAAPPRDAWSYALSTTRGVSLRSGARPLKRIAQDSVFPPFRGAVELYDLRQDPGETRNLALGREAGRSWERLVREVRPGGRAIQVRVENSGPGEIRGRLGGTATDFMVTAPDLDFDCCAAGPNGVEFHAPAGESFTLLLQDRPGGSLELRLKKGERAWVRSFPLAGLPPRLRIAWNGERWQPAAAAQAGTGAWSGVEIRRDGPVAGDAPLSDSEILGRLRALGYIQ